SLAARSVVAVELLELNQGLVVFFLGEIRTSFEVAQGKEVGSCLSNKLSTFAAEFPFFLVAHFLDPFLFSLLNLGVIQFERFQNRRGRMCVFHAPLDESTDKPAQIRGATKALVAASQLEDEPALRPPAFG